MLVLTAAILRDPRDNEPPVSDEKKAIFYAEAELNVRCPFLELELNANDRNTRESRSHSSYIPY
jgi:hypothetical protein